MRNLKQKLMVLFGGMVAFVCFGLGIVSYICSKNALENNLQDTLPQVAVQTANFINSSIQGKLDNLETISGGNTISNPDVSLLDKAGILKKQAERIGALQMLYIDVNGNSVDQDGVISSGVDDTYYKRALKGESNVTDPTVVEGTEKLTVAYTVPVKFNGEIVGILRAVNDGNEISEMTDKVNFGETGKAYILNGKGVTIAHVNRAMVLRMDCVIDQVKENPAFESLAEVNKKMINGESGLDKYSYKDKKYFASYSPIEGTDWSVAVQVEDWEVLSQNDTLKKLIFIVSFIFLGAALIFTYNTSKILSKKITRNSEHLMLLAEGDLSVDIPDEYLKVKDETGEMANSMKKMQDSLREVIRTIKANSSNINAHSESLSAVAEEISSSSQTVTEAISGVALGSTNQTENIKVIVDTLESFDNKLSKMVENVYTVDADSRDIGKKASSSNEQMNVLNDSLLSMSHSFNEFHSKISQFGQDVKEIDEIISLINDVAEQTNLLALNASIEAARAGESGKGFAVVASEIGNLADQSKKSAEEISRLIASISKNTEGIVSNSLEIDNGFKNQVETINSSMKSFKEIVENVDHMIPNIDTLRLSAEEIDKDKNDILHKIDELSEVAVSVSSSTEEISASSEEMNATTEEIASSAQILSNMTNEMMEEVNKFKTE